MSPHHQQGEVDHRLRRRGAGARRALEGGVVAQGAADEAAAESPG